MKTIQKVQFYVLIASRYKLKLYMHTKKLNH